MFKEKFMDFKFITIFRIFILAFAILAFLFPWTEDFDYTEWGEGGFGSSRHYYSSGYDYMRGCQPIPNSSFFAKMVYLIFNPIILFMALLLALYEKKKYVIGSMIVGGLSTIPVIIWIINLSYLKQVNLSIGPLLIFLMVGINTALGLFILAFCDLDTDENPEQKAEHAKTN